MWGAGEFEVLLVRIEEQARAKAAARRRARGRPCPGMRARQLVREGAYSKGVAALTTSVAELAPAEQQDWARRLLPASSVPATALADSVPPPAESADAEEDAGATSAPGSAALRKAALGGVRFPALSGLAVRHAA